MSTITTKYWIEANVDGVPKTVPHNEKGDHLFIVKKPAEKYIKYLRKANPSKKFRLVTYRAEVFREQWA